MQRTCSGTNCATEFTESASHGHQRALCLIYPPLHLECTLRRHSSHQLISLSMSTWTFSFSRLPFYDPPYFVPLPVLFVRLVLDHREAFSRAYKLLTAASLHLRGLIRVVHAWWPKKIPFKHHPKTRYFPYAFVCANHEYF